MRIVHTSCAEIDVHTGDITVSLITRTTAGQPVRSVPSYRTVTKDLLAMRDWLQDHNCEVVAIDSTGVYWKPVFNLLKDDFEVLLVNPAHLNHVPGPKTDVKDSE